MCVSVQSSVKGGRCYQLARIVALDFLPVPGPYCVPFSSIVQEIRQRDGSLFFRLLTPHNQYNHLLFCSGSRVGKQGDLGVWSVSGKQGILSIL